MDVWGKFFIYDCSRLGACMSPEKLIALGNLYKFSDFGSLFIRGTHYTLIVDTPAVTSGSAPQKGDVLLLVPAVAYGSHAQKCDEF